MHPSSSGAPTRKVLLVANTGWYLYNFRLSLARYLVEQGFEVGLVSPADEFLDLLARQGFFTIPWNLERQAVAPLEEWRSIRALARIYRRERPVLAHHFTIKPVIYGSLAARIAQLPATINSVTGRGYVFLGSSARASAIRTLVQMLFYLAYFRFRVATTFENESDLAFFVQSGLVPNRNVYLINGVGVDIHAFDYAAETLADAPLIVFPGRLLWAKGVGTLVDAARVLKDRLPVRIILVGRPDPGNPESIDEQIIRDWVEQGLVEWWGWQADMRAVYHQCHIVALPSMGEGLSKALLESASCGRPIVATDVQGCREVVIPGVTGFLVPPGDALALAEKLERLVRDPLLREQMGKSGRRLVEENYADHLVNQQMFGVYRSILSL